MFAVAEAEVFSVRLVVKKLHVVGCGHVLVVECCFIDFCIGVFFFFLSLLSGL